MRNTNLTENCKPHHSLIIISRLYLWQGQTASLSRCGRYGSNSQRQVAGKGDKTAADAAATIMRATFDNVLFDGRVAIGEGERDEAPMLHIGERLGVADNPNVAAVDIVADLVECTNNCADNLPNSIAVLVAAPVVLYYMRQIVTWTKLRLDQRWRGTLH